MTPLVGRIDLHSHLLPGVDDGCQTVADSIACAAALAEAGYTHACCTPHVWPNFPGNNRRQIPLAVSELQRHLLAARVPITLIAGGEMNLRPDTVSLAEGDIVSYAMAGRFVLADLWADSLPSFFLPAIKHLQSFGLTVILAHPERMRAVQDDPTLAELFINHGLLLQGNLQCFADPPGSPTRRTAERLLAEGRYHVVGSDTHNFENLAIRLEGLQTLRRTIGDAAVDELTIHRPRAIVSAQIVASS